MLDRIETIRHQFTRHETLDGRIDHAFEAIKNFGFGAMIYDYTQIPIDPHGNIAIPSLMKLRISTVACMNTGATAAISL